MREALQKGTLGISALSPRVTTGKEQWQEWHHDFYHNQMRDFIQDDIDLHAAADEMNTDLEVITLREAKQTALEVCKSFQHRRAEQERRRRHWLKAPDLPSMQRRACM